MTSEETISLNAIGKKYDLNSDEVKKAALYMRACGYIGNRIAKRSRTYFLISLPDTYEEVKETYKEKFLYRPLSSWLSDGLEMIEDLKTELEDWADSMAGTNLEQTEKCDNLWEIVNELENIGTIDHVKFPAEIGDLSIFCEEPYQTAFYPNPSRQKRYDNAICVLECVKEALASNPEVEKFLITFTKESEELDLIESDITDVTDMVDEIQELEIPGMF